MGRGSDDAVGNSLRVCRELAEGIGSLLGWRKGVHRKIVGGSRKAYRKLGRLDIEPWIRRCGGSSPGVRWTLPKVSGRSLGTRREITRGRS
ncbi:hypothetical protein B296_00029209 [Ensete ventricosum]|uniref:Uncharacterized protein n=1 Tax=Ensete ventricosum TaxID=4639 RepID=A0A427AB04_ENSVE|nr:hypothetical protein B296_00029209 [Ensete ventricosum]